MRTGRASGGAELSSAAAFQEGWWGCALGWQSLFYGRGRRLEAGEVNATVMITRGHDLPGTRGVEVIDEDSGRGQRGAQQAEDSASSPGNE